MRHIQKCVKCDAYTMQDTHCDVKVKGVKPAKYSPEDKYAGYRREVLAGERKEKGIL
tara:strand:- start:171 stop:341 length:171 start_codon:yes stop_codon:yes gene_type:complete